MRQRPFRGQPAQKSVEASIWKPGTHCRYGSSRESEADQPAGDIHPIGLPEQLRRPQGTGSARGELVMVANHCGDDLSVSTAWPRLQVSRGKKHGRLDVIEGVGGPDAEIMEGGRDEHMLPHIIRAPVKHAVERCHPARMVAIRGVLVCQKRFMGREKGIDPGGHTLQVAHTPRSINGLRRPATAAW